MINDICFGNCCLYPNEIVDFYESDAESDEEVGMVFQQIKDTVDELETLKGEEVDAK